MLTVQDHNVPEDVSAIRQCASDSLALSTCCYVREKVEVRDDVCTAEVEIEPVGGARRGVAPG